MHTISNFWQNIRSANEAAATHDRAEKTFVDGPDCFNDASLHDSPAHTQVRQRVVALIRAQAEVTPLQTLENLARGNRQIAVLAAIVSAQAGKNIQKMPPGRVSRCQDPLPPGFAETGIKSLIRRKDIAAFAEPDFKMMNQALANRQSLPTSSVNEEATSRTKTQMIVETLVKACEKVAIQPGLDVPAIGSSNVANPDKDFLYHAPLATNLQGLGQLTGIKQPMSNCNVPSSMTRQKLPALNENDLACLMANLDLKNHDELILRTVEHSGEIAVFFSFVEHALLIGNVKKEHRLRRYEYEEDFGALADQYSATGEPWFDTFLEGVQRNLHATGETEQKWRILVGKDWQYPENKQQLLSHVFLQALEHLHAQQLQHAEMPVYPLVIYELLGDAVGKEVPGYLVEHENGILEKLQANEAERATRSKAQKDQLAIAHQERDLRSQARAQEFTDNRVSNALQLHFCKRGFDWQKIVAGTVDRLIPVAPLKGSASDFQKLLHRTLLRAHDRQEISYVNHEGTGRDNLCWLRSGWISLFSATTPEHLASRLIQVCTPDMGAAKHAPMIGKIAAQYRKDPIGFMHGNEARALGSGLFSQPARLGPPRSPDFQTEGGVQLPKKNIETYLKDVQLHLAAAFRFENPSIMNEIESFMIPGQFASSDMLIALHRAFGVPALVIETSPAVKSSNEADPADISLQFRLTCPEDCDFARALDAPCEQSAELNYRKAEGVVNQFRNRPVIWLEHEHFVVYLPKSLGINAQPLEPVLP